MFAHSVTEIRGVISAKTASSLFRVISYISTQTDFTVDYLIKSCNLSPQSALKASQRVVLKSKSGADSVISLLRAYGISQSQIPGIISKSPKILVANPDKTLKPKLEFFSSVGFSGSDLEKLLSRDPTILRRNLERVIIPYINAFRSLLPNDSGIAIILSKSRTRWVHHNTEHILRSNIKVLEDHGVPQSNISKCLRMRPEVIFFESVMFKKMVLEAERLGFDVESMLFLRALYVLLSIKKPLWDAKVAAFRSFDWSEDEFLSLFKRGPDIMSTSVKKINLALAFCKNVLNLTPNYVSRNPFVITLSMKKRVIPRYYVLQTLISKDLVAKSSVCRALKETEDDFIKKFVVKYHHEVPDLLKMYQIKKGTPGLLHQPEDN